jgi:hypothetical protein
VTAPLIGLNTAMWLSVGSGIFLAFGWPFLISGDPAGEPYRVLSVATLVVFLVALLGIVIAKALDRHDASGTRG